MNNFRNSIYEILLVKYLSGSVTPPPGSPFQFPSPLTPPSPPPFSRFHFKFYILVSREVTNKSKQNGVNKSDKLDKLDLLSKLTKKKKREKKTPWNQRASLKTKESSSVAIKKSWSSKRRDLWVEALAPPAEWRLNCTITSWSLQVFKCSYKVPGGGVLRMKGVGGVGVVQKQKFFFCTRKPYCSVLCKNSKTFFPERVFFFFFFAPGLIFFLSLFDQFVSNQKLFGKTTLWLFLWFAWFSAKEKKKKNNCLIGSHNHLPPERQWEERPASWPPGAVLIGPGNIVRVRGRCTADRERGK